MTNDHYLKNKFKSNSTEELESMLLSANVFDLSQEPSDIQAEIERREREA